MVKILDKIRSPFIPQAEKPLEKSRSLAVLEEPSPDSADPPVRIRVQTRSGHWVWVDPRDFLPRPTLDLDRSGVSGGSAADYRQGHQHTTQAYDQSHHDNSTTTTTYNVHVDRRRVDNRKQYTIVVPGGARKRRGEDSPPQLPPAPPAPPAPPPGADASPLPKRPRQISWPKISIPAIWWLISALLGVAVLTALGIWSGQLLSRSDVMWLLGGIAAAGGILYMIPKQLFRSDSERSIAGMLAAFVIGLILVYLSLLGS